MLRIGNRGRAERRGGANAPRAQERRAVDGERHRATRRGCRCPARLRMMEAGSRCKAPEGPPPFPTPEAKPVVPVFQSSPSWGRGQTKPMPSSLTFLMA
ncbi:hypothetical protein VPH35_132129 [Triticum aestivum]